MQIYKVGGAVRDTLLGREVVDHDYVVVGASVEDMLSQGFLPVGKDFPVFLHPTTKEEYALARTERKTSVGYHGFEFFAEPSVTLEQDLQRRDLTINAIAEDDNGNLYDPYDGLRDIKQKVLRHVSPAFSEDPLRVLRVARFAARFSSLGFSIAEETLALMHELVINKELESLVAERVWQETHKALSSESPEVFFETLRQCHALAVLYPELDQLFGVPQSKQWHPEIDCGVHTMIVLQQAARLTKSVEVRFAALVHDLGKGITPKDQWPKHVAHEHNGIALVEQLCQRLKVPANYRDLALIVTAHHLNYHRINELKATTVIKLFNTLDAFRRPERFNQFLLACEADEKGRLGFENTPNDKRVKFKQLLAIANSVDVKDIVAAGYQGKAVAEQLYQKRVEAIRLF